MKRLIILLLATLLLAACGSKVHENISQDMADDTSQVLGIYDKSQKEDRLFTDKETMILDDYILTYGARSKASDHSLSLSEEESRLHILTRNLIEMNPGGVLTKSDEDSYKNTKKSIQNVIKSGQIYD